MCGSSASNAYGRSGSLNAILHLPQGLRYRRGAPCPVAPPNTGNLRGNVRSATREEEESAHRSAARRGPAPGLRTVPKANAPHERLGLRVGDLQEREGHPVGLPLALLPRLYGFGAGVQHLGKDVLREAELLPDQLDSRSLVLRWRQDDGFARG